ncbi:glycosyltransferase family A protein [Chitinophaga sp. OAE865]|uniref:glycosyltransferase family 2 protein n=1 Tax=Chitinophaga sp. OAE865 TaxID=2817898 RepID=UPI001AE4D270
MLSSPPLISCICVTYRKPDMLARAIRCFVSQTYTNKELVILYEDHDLPTLHFLAWLPQDDRIKLVCVNGSPKKTLGELRNLAVLAADGEFVCQWDDDDWYHMDRLTHQYHAICNSQASGCLLTRWLVFDKQTGKAFVSNQRRWEGSIMCRKTIFCARKYDHKAKGEDTDVIDYLHNNQHLTYIDDRPDLYLYVYHGSNTWGVDHFSKIFEASRELTDYSAVFGRILNNEFSPEECLMIINDMEFGLIEVKDPIGTNDNF